MAAAIPGLIDLLSIKDATVTKIMSINLIVVVLYAVNIWLRVSGGGNRGAPLVLSVIAVALLAVSGWLGGEMVYVHGVGVGDRASRS